MSAVSAVHNYDTPMLTYGLGDTRDDKPLAYMRGDILARSPTARITRSDRVSMEKLAHDLTESKLVRAYLALL